jgi:peptidoglycan/LPS O-acetylase OafA/YrhL
LPTRAALLHPISTALPNREVTVSAATTDPKPNSSAAPPRRFRSLDGLRGVAAMVVVGYHILLVIPAVSRAFSSADASTWSVEWWLYRTPLRLFFAGHEAVLVFFVLSGFVLTLPLRPQLHQTGSWLSYYGRRLIRLYLPVWGSLVFALVLAVLVTRNVNAASPWIAAHKPPTAIAFAKDLLLLIGTSNLNSPLWSLRWEMWFSLLLPIMLLAIVLLRMFRWWKTGAVILAAISAIAQLPQVGDALPGAFLTVGLLQYLPIFGIGMLLAFNLEALDRYVAALRRIPMQRAAWTALVVVALLFVVSPSFVSREGAGYTGISAVAYFASVLGVMVVIFLGVEARPFVAFLERRPVQWLGHRSFSIYLVHEPIVVAVALLTRADGWLPWLFIGIGLIPVILIVAEVFFRFVERPAHRLSRIVGKRLTRASKKAPSLPPQTSTSAIPARLE